MEGDNLDGLVANSGMGGESNGESEGDTFFAQHTDLVHHEFAPGYTHLHQDTIPEVGGDTLWASGYAAYDKLSPKFKSLLDGLKSVA